MRITNSMLHSLNSARMSSIRSSWSSNTSRRTHGFAAGSLRSGRNHTAKISEGYKDTQKAAADVREQAEKLTETGKDSLWEKAEKSGSNEDILDTVNRFVKSYNSMIDGMQKTGGSLNHVYRAQLMGAAASDKSVLKEIGITAGKDGRLTVDSKKLKGAGLEDLKKAFGGSSSFAGQAAVKSIYIEANAVSGMSQQSSASYLGYNNLGGFYNYGIANTGTGNYFNSLY